MAIERQQMGGFFSKIKTSSRKTHPETSCLILQEEVAELKCPITQYYFCIPMVLGCGHLVEAMASKSCQTCPLCRQPIESIAEAPPLIYRLLEQASKRIPEFNDNRGFYIEYLNVELQRVDFLENQK